MTYVVEPLRLSVPADIASLGPVRRLLQSWLSSAGVEHGDDIVLAVHEAVANALEHAGLDTDEVITVEAEVVDDVLRVLVRDGGAWKEQVADDTRGRGLGIIRAVMDRVELDSRIGSTSIEMSRRLR